ncbi:MAG: HTTM domain-containing protein [Proteobacteria bacterium]|nr:HTTM domain-containing protein [Pseudomonadota bacterium]
MNRVFGLDLRSLALLRVCIGLMLLVDLAVCAGDLRAHYTDFGILPRAELGLYTFRTVWTLHGFASPYPALVASLFALAAGFAVALIVGWHTWLATFGSWLLLASLQYRNPALVFGGDVMLRMLLFWGLLLPLGARGSIDARRDPSRFPRSNQYASVASAALIAQLLLVYVFSVLNRTGPTWWNGDALFYALNFDQFASRFGVMLRPHETLLAPMTYIAIWFEALGPLLLIAPIANGPLRTLAVLLFVGFHVTLGLLFNIGIFPGVFSVAWIGMLPAWFWQRFGARESEPAAETHASRWRWNGAREAVAAVALAFVLLSNLSTVRGGALADRFPNNWDLPAQLAASRLRETAGRFRDDEHPLARVLLPLAARCQRPALGIVRSLALPCLERATRRTRAPRSRLRVLRRRDDDASRAAPGQHPHADGARVRGGRAPLILAARRWLATREAAR